MKRRVFFKSVGTASLGLFALKSWPEITPTVAVPLNHIRDFSPADDRFWKIVRQQFPLTRDRVFFNTGGIGASPYVVIGAVKKKMDELEQMGEVGRTQQKWGSIKNKVARFISVDPEEIALTGCCTEGMNIAANGLPLNRGDEVVVTTHEHVGGALPWLGRQKRDGIVVKTFEPGITAHETMTNLQRAVTRKTRVISISHITCTTGAILPVQEISEFARSKNIWSVIDGAQAIGHIPVSVREIGCDCYATSGHKWMLGPKRTGVLFVRKDLLDTIKPHVIGAYSNEWWDYHKGLEYHPTAQRYEYGTYNVPVMHGLGVAVDFLSEIGMRTIYERNHALASEAIQSLLEIPNVELLTPLLPENFGSIVTIRMKNISTSDLQRYLTEKYKLRTRYVAEAELDALRISIHLYNERDDIQKFIDGVTKAAQL